MAAKIRWKLELHVNVSSMEVVGRAELELDIFVHIEVNVILRFGREHARVQVVEV
jgi:hypothetical protein